MKTYKLKMTLLTPMHIGIGESYEPTNFVIDNGFLYEFDEFSFFESLSKEDKTKFEELVTREDNLALSSINKFIKKRKDIVKNIFTLKVKVTQGIEKEYNRRIGIISKFEGSGIKKPVINQFQIQKTIKDEITGNPYITGSSIKGSISTAYQEYIYKNSNYSKLKETFQMPSESIFKNISISDTKILNSSSLIGFSLNKERFEDDNQGPSTKIEVICEKSEFETSLQIKDYNSKEQITIEKIIKSCNDHYYELFDSMFRQKNLYKDSLEYDFIIDYFREDFYEKYLNFEFKNKNQFLLRIGKHSGARTVTIDGLRNIKVKVSGGGPKRKKNIWENLEEETTTWLFGENEDSIDTLLPFGWVLCEIEE
ncbi:MAG: RAMP superfamily CRISPR-associated protein [Halarcobacter sp.]